MNTQQQQLHELATETPKVKMKTIYVLRIRADESEPWSEPEYYRRRKERDRIASMNRILGGIRTHSYEEKKPLEEIEELFN